MGYRPEQKTPGDLGLFDPFKDEKDVDEEKVVVEEEDVGEKEVDEVNI